MGQLPGSRMRSLLGIGLMLRSSNKVWRWRTGFMETPKKYRGLLNRDVLKAEDGVKYFRDKLRPHFVKGAYSVFLWRVYLFIRARRGNTEMVDWIDKFDLLLKRVKDSWMYMLPVSSMTEQQRESQYQADIARLNGEWQGRNQAALDPNQQATRDNWYATHVATHGSLFPFSDNLTTLMFIVGSDLNEARRERLTSSLSLRNITVTAYTLDTVQTVFVELFCTPKSSIGNPSLRVSGHGSSASKTFIVENYAEDEYGLWAIDEATGEQGYIDDERSCFRTWDDNEHVWQSRKFQDRQVKGKKGKEKTKGKGGFKGVGAYLGEEQTQDNEWWSEEDSVWGPRVRKARKGFRRVRTNFLKLILVPFIKKKVQIKNINRTKEQIKIRGEKEKQVPIPISTFCLRNTEWRRTWPFLGIWWLVFKLHWFLLFNYWMVWHWTYCMDGSTSFEFGQPSDTRCSDLGCTRSIESRAAIRRSRNMCCIMALQKSFALATSPLCLPTLRWRLVGKVASLIFRRNFHVRPELRCWKQVMCLSYSPFLRWKIWEWLLSWIRRETKLHVRLFVCTLLQMNILLWDTLSWIWRVLRTS